MTGSSASGPDGRTTVLWLARGLGPGGMERLLVPHARLGDPERFRYVAAYLTERPKSLPVELEAAGLVRREQCPNDRRGFFAVLTPEGRTLMEETAPHHVAGVRAHFLDQVRPEELEASATACARVDEAFGPEGRGPGA